MGDAASNDRLMSDLRAGINAYVSCPRTDTGKEIDKHEAVLPSQLQSHLMTLLRSSGDANIRKLVLIRLVENVGNETVSIPEISTVATADLDPETRGLALLVLARSRDHIEEEVIASFIRSLPKVDFREIAEILSIAREAQMGIEECRSSLDRICELLAPVPPENSK